jgi:fucose permease
VSNWGGLYLHDVYGLDVRVAGAAFVATFYVLFTASRLVSGFAVEKIGYMRSLYVSAFALIAVYAVGFGLGVAGIGILTLSGIFIAILWPTIISVVSRTFGDDAPIVSSAIITISGAVNGVFQWVIGLTDQYVGKAWGFRSNIVYAVAVVAMLTVLSLKLKKREAVQ